VLGPLLRSLNSCRQLGRVVTTMRDTGRRVESSPGLFSDAELAVA
jgi:hypothetical protein